MESQTAGSQKQHLTPCAAVTPIKLSPCSGEHQFLRCKEKDAVPGRKEEMPEFQREKKVGEKWEKWGKWGKWGK